MAAWRALLEAHATVTDVLEEELQSQRSLPLTWYDVLHQLQGHGGRLRMQELARLVLLSKSGLTRLFDRMERGGLVRREACVEDRRGTVAAITPQGRAALKRAAPVHLRGVEEHFAEHISDDEARVIAAALKRVIEANESAFRGA